MIRTKEDYWKFRDEVIRKATGATIHDINGKLGNILNRITALEEKNPIWNKYKELYKKEIDQYEKEILKLC